MKRTFVPIVLALLLIGTQVSSAAATTTPKAPVADLAVRLNWIGLGTPRVMNGGRAAYVVSVANRGPSSATGVHVEFGMGDQFNPAQALCGSGQRQSLTECGFARIRAHATVHMIFVAEVCCFVVGESREASVNARVDSQTADPNSDNNFQSLTTRILGPPTVPVSSTS